MFQRFKPEMGITLCQYRAHNGGFVSKLYSTNWKPGSSGRARVSIGTGSSLSSSRCVNNLLGMMFLLMRLIVIGIPFLQCGRNENNYNSSAMSQKVEVIYNFNSKALTFINVVL